MTARFQGFLASKAPNCNFVHIITDYVEMPKMRICRLVGSFSFSNAGQWPVECRPRIAVSSLGRHWTGRWIRPSLIHDFSLWKSVWVVMMYWCAATLSQGTTLAVIPAQKIRIVAQNQSDRRHHWLTGSTVSFAHALLVIIITSVSFWPTASKPALGEARKGHFNSDNY